MREPQEIELYCDDDPRHARGKVAKIATFYRKDSGAWTFRGAVRRAGRKYRQDVRADTGALFVCKLCRRKLPLWAEERQVLFGCLNRLAAQGESRVRLSELCALASEIEKG